MARRLTQGPVDSPMRRSILIRNAINAHSMINDDEAERRQRRSEAAAENSTSSIEDNENLKICLKLYADNKITKENAWSVSVIDTFSKMIEKHHKSLQNFQVAGSTLEASSKVYSLRVDSVHTDVMRMCSELTRQSNKNVAAPADESMDESMAVIDGVDENIPQNQNDAKQPKKKQKKQRRHISTVTKNKDTINGKLETNPFTDPFFAKLNSIVGDINSSSRLMQNIIPTSSSVLKLGMDFPSWDSGPAINPEVDAELRLDDEDLPVVRVTSRPSALTSSTMLQPSLAGYVLSDLPAEEDDEDIMEREREAAEAEANRQNTLNNSQLAVQFDINAEVEAIPVSEAFFMDYGGGADNDEAFDELTVEEQSALNACRGLKRPAEVIEDMRPINSTSISLEYSYRPLINDFWAGPSHWKFKRVRSKATRSISRIGDDETGEPLPKQQKKKHRKKAMQTTKLTLEDFDKDVNHLFTKFDASKNVSTQTKYRKWSKNAEKLKLPTDLKLDRDRYYKYYFAPGLSVHNDTAHINLSESIQDEHVVINETETDADFASMDDAPFDNNAEPDLFGNQEPDLNMPANTTVDVIPTEFQGAPERVTKINIAYARTAKVVDMKQLKGCCWRLITEKSQPSIDDAVVASSSHALPDSEPKCVHFNDVMHQLPKILHRNMADNVSTSLAFYSVLHLANEKGLILEQQIDLKDFQIKHVNS